MNNITTRPNYDNDVVDHVSTDAAYIDRENNNFYRHYHRSRIHRRRWILCHGRPGASFQFFLGAKFFFIFQCHWTIEKLEKNSTLYVVIDAIHSSLFSVFLFFVFSFSFFFLFFSFSLGEGAEASPAPPPQMTPLWSSVVVVVVVDYDYSSWQPQVVSHPH